MKKWSKSLPLQIYSLDYVLKLFKNETNFNIIQVNDKECDGIVSVTTYHDGTLVFELDGLARAMNQIFSTHTKKIGTIQMQTDFIYCDMKYGDNQRVERNIITIPFIYESVEE